jgi:hypothetical protein
MHVYRVQGVDGRGPWRPGFSERWIEADAPADRLTETIFDLVPLDGLRRLPLGFDYGCACRSLDALMHWFTPIERERLAALGFSPVRLVIDVVVVESATQLLAGRRRPFRDGATRYRWSR